RTLGVQGAGLPSFTTQNQASEFSLTTAEFDLFYKNYVDLQNTGVKPVGASVPQGATAAAVDTALPDQVVLDYNDGSTKSLPVDWTEESLDTSRPGTYEVTGTVQQHREEMVSEARADPHVFFNPDDGYYYLTGSHYAQSSLEPVNESQSYRKIGLKRATTIEGLKDAPEQIVVDPDAGTPGREGEFPNTHYGWGGFIWAQEFHKINGTWWIVAGMNKGYAPVGGWCDNTVLIPYTGTDASIAAGGFLERGNWGEPVILDGAAFDVSYFERTEAGAKQGYWVMPIGGQIMVAKVKQGPKGTVPLVDGTLSRVYGESQPWEIGKQSPTPSDTTEGRDQGVVEAPFMVQQGDRIHITYSGGTVDKYYSLGMLTADATADLQNPASWTQTPFPVLTTNDTSAGRIGADEDDYYTKDHAGGGHNSFLHDTSGNLLLAYHARPYPEPHQASDPNGAGGLFDADRNTWFKAVNVRANGALDLSLTKAQEVAPGNRTVRATVTVVASTAPVTATAVSRCIAGKVVVTLTAKNTGATAAEIRWSTPWGAKVQQVGAMKTSSLAISTRATSVAAGTLTGTSTANGVQTPLTATYAAARCS
ncbi:family 43 glycosylhydrolase, partial [Rathayibacter sp. AY1A3]|uniref:family 43 glycosylhydrolase n=1 Tax=Rathayibacter sp. AY1A3 TaxID=2080521 RepID=UPI001CA52EA7